MKTFLSWLVANFETALTVILCLVFGLLFTFNFDWSGTEPEVKWGLICIAVFCMAMPASMTAKNLGMCTITFLFVIGAYIYLFTVLGGSDADYFKSIISGATLLGVISLIMAIIIGIYTAVNMDDVVSLRMLYVNSDVDMFEMTLLYSLNRAMTAFIYITWAGFWTVVYNTLKNI